MLKAIYSFELSQSVCPCEWKQINRERCGTCLKLRFISEHSIFRNFQKICILLIWHYRISTRCSTDCWNVLVFWQTLAKNGRNKTFCSKHKIEHFYCILGVPCREKRAHFTLKVTLTLSSRASAPLRNVPSLFTVLDWKWVPLRQLQIIVKNNP